MGTLETFRQAVGDASDRFLSRVPDQAPIKVLTHLDADGVSSAAIISRTLHKVGRPFSLSVIPGVDEDTITTYVSDNDHHLILADFGSGQLSVLKNHINDRNVLILDHHEIEDSPMPSHWSHINAREHGLDGNAEISGAGVSYVWAQHMLEDASRLAWYALIGAIGDIQEQEGFVGANNIFLTQACETGMIATLRMPKFYGAQTKPLTRVLTNSDVHIPGVSNNPGAAERLLRELGISTMIGERPMSFFDLTAKERSALERGIIQRRRSLERPDDIYWTAYLVNGEEDRTTLRDLREISTLLNACGRLSKPSIGVGLLLRDQGCRGLSKIVSDAYKKKIIESIRWYKENKQDAQAVIARDKLLLIRAQGNVLGTMIGTLASIIANDNDVAVGTYIISMAHIENNKTKVSIRLAGDRGVETDVDLSTTMQRIIDTLGSGQAGGHAMAAGAVIDTDSEDEFIQAALHVFDGIKPNISVPDESLHGVQQS